ncbi:type III secretion system chaperone [Pigmentiphaga aceris]|nr:type III secretion system chaperone [Pigmentiphaga aceris]
MDISSLIALFGEQAGTPLALNQGGTLALAFDNDLTVNLEHDASQDVLHLYVIVGQEPADYDARPAFYRELLVANVFGHDTGGASLGIDDVSGEVLLTLRLPLVSAEVGTLRDAVQSVVETANAWRERLAAPTRAVPAAANAPYISTMASFDFRA